MKRAFPFERVLIAFAALILAGCLLYNMFSGSQQLSPVTASVTVQNVDENKISINTATEAELLSLEGIGKVRAAKIIEYRTENGEFSSIEEIKEINGIGDKIFEKIKDFICI